MPGRYNIFNNTVVSDSLPVYTQLNWSYYYWRNLFFSDFENIAMREEILNELEMKQLNPATESPTTIAIKEKNLKDLHSYLSGVEQTELDKDAFKTFLLQQQAATQISGDPILDGIDKLLEGIRTKTFKHFPGDGAFWNRRADEVEKFLSKLSSNEQARVQAEPTNPWPITLALIEAWRAFHILRLATARSFNLHKQEHDAWGGDEDKIDAGSNIETPFVVGSMTYLCVLGLVANVYFYNKKELTEIERARMQFEMWDAFVWSIINVLRLGGAGVGELDSDAGKIDMSIGDMTSGILLLTGYVFDFINQLIYDLRQVNKMNQDLKALKEKKQQLQSSSQSQPLDEQTEARIAAYDVLINELTVKREEFVRRSVFCNMLYATGLASGAILNLAGVKSLGLVFASTTPLGIAIIFLATFINQMKNWYVAVQEYKEVKQRCAKQHNALSALTKNLLDNADWSNVALRESINADLIKSGLKPLHNDQFTVDGIKNYRAAQYHAMSSEMRAANNKVLLYSYWFAVVLTSMACFAFAPALVVGLGVLLVGTGVYCLMKFGPLKHLMPITASSSTSKLFAAYAYEGHAALGKDKINAADEVSSPVSSNPNPPQTGNTLSST